MNEVLARHTGKDIDAIQQDTDRDNFMTAQDAVAYGLIDRVVENRDKESNSNS